MQREPSAMAKTKRRQLAALAAQAELKERLSRNECFSSYLQSDPGGSLPKAGDPNVEVRTQRVIIKIPALPSKPAASVEPQKIATKEKLAKGRRKRPQMDINATSEQVPADEAKISKGVPQFGRWKKHKKMGDLFPSGAVSVSPSSRFSPSARFSNGVQPSPEGKSMAYGKHSNGALHATKTGPQGRSKTTRLKVKTGSRKAARLQEAAIRFPAKNASKQMENQKNAKEAKPDGRQQELGSASSGDLPSNVAQSPVTKKRIRGTVKKMAPDVPVAPKAATVISPHRTRSRTRISYCEATALEVLQEIRNVKSVSERTEHSAQTPAKDSLLRRISDGERGDMGTAQNQAQAEAQSSGNFTSPVRQGGEQEAHNGGIAARSSSHDPPGASMEEDMPFAAGEQGVFPVAAKQGRGLGPGRSAAELLKRDSQLRIMQKRLDAAGGLRKWLLDKGLGQVLPMLEKWNLDHLSLMQLTMEGLRNMGLLPVGPRRKLIHAISSLTLPSFPAAPLRRANPR